MRIFQDWNSPVELILVCRTQYGTLGGRQPYMPQDVSGSSIAFYNAPVRQHSYAVHMMKPSSRTQVLQTISGQLSTTVHGTGFFGSFGRGNNV